MQTRRLGGFCYFWLWLGFPPQVADGPRGRQRNTTRARRQQHLHEQRSGGTRACGHTVHLPS